MADVDGGLVWRVSTRCGNGACVAVANGDNGVTHVRDSKDPDSPWLMFSRAGWRAFLDHIRAGEFDPS